MASKVGSIAGRMYRASMFFFASTAVYGTAFIALSRSSRFFGWQVSDCVAQGVAKGVVAPSEEGIYTFNLDMTADIGWNRFTVTSLNQAAAQAGLCFGDLTQGTTYPLEDYQDNGATLAGYGMVASWGVGVLVALYTLIALKQARFGQRRGGVSLVGLTNWCALFAVGVVTATTVFWWLVEGKFGDRQEALAPRLFQLVKDAAVTCSEGTNEDLCRESTWAMDAPGWALALGITAMFAYAAATLLLWIIAARVDHMNSGAEELEMVDPAKPPVSGNVVVEKTPQPEEKARAKDRRSAKTGVRSGRAPNSTVTGGADDADPDPMTYAFEQGDEELGSGDDEEEVVYQNHQVHHAVINHSNANPTKSAEDHHPSQQYSRSYSRGTSGGSHVIGGDPSFEEGLGAYSETASSAQYYAHNRGQGGSGSFMSSSSRGESFDEYS
ncbi:unnamed protein product [Pylaiella littoralis]